MEPPNYRDWLAQTNLGALHTRSPQLRDLDKAIEAFSNNKNPADRGKYLSRINQALQIWGRTCPGGDARNSSRNKNGVVTRLVEAVTTQRQITAADKEIFLWQENERRERMKRIFHGKSVQWKAADPFRDAMQAIRNLKSGATAPRRGDIKGIAPKGSAPFRPDREEILNVKQDLASNNAWARRTSPGLVAGGQVALSVGAEAVAFQKMITSLFNGGNSGAALSILGTSMPALIADALPIISLVKSGVQMLYYWGRAAQSLWQESDTQTHSSFLSGETDIAAALKALAVMLDRQTTQYSVTASIQSADFAARGAAHFADAGTASSSAIGAISNLAKLVQQLYLFARELVATQRANRILSSPGSFGLQLFEAYPLLGCYMLCCSDTSELVSLVRTGDLKPYTPYAASNWQKVQFGEVGWMDKVEFIKKEHLDPVLQRAITFINASPFYVSGMAMHVKRDMGLLNMAGWGAGKANAAYNLATVVGNFA
jgi:hypothetical protein